MMRRAMRAISATVVLWTAMTVFVSCGSGSPPSPAGESDGATGDESVARTSQALTKGTAGANNGNADYCDNPSNKCNVGEGDCDTDAQCVTPLVCGHAQGRRFGLAADVDVCVPSHCADEKPDGPGETGVDCGGECGTCKNACSPLNGAENGTETACNGDCLCASGWSDCDSDGECAPGLVCALTYGGRFDFASGLEVCVPRHCYNDQPDPALGETGVDSGGECGHALTECNYPAGGSSYCAGCACGLGQGHCRANRECLPGMVCTTGQGPRFNNYSAGARVCVPTHCDNNTQEANLGETGIDCGGDCGPCLTSAAQCTGPAGGADYCTTCLCGSGLGDCDRNRDCKPGLACIGNGASFGFPSVQVCIASALSGTEIACDGAECCPGGTAVVSLTSQADTLQSSTMHRCIVGGDGADNITSTGVYSVILGGPGDDWLYANLGSYLKGGPGDDHLIQTAINAGTILGNDGNDSITARTGAYVVPGKGADNVSSVSGPVTVAIYDLCEIGSGEQLTGSTSTTDTLILPRDPSELTGLGLNYGGFETIDVQPHNACKSECTQKPNCGPNGFCMEDVQPGAMKCGCNPGYMWDGTTCVCEPNCAKKKCGDDPNNGCGGTCDIPFCTYTNPPASNYVAWWKFDEGSGTTTVDSSSNGNNCVLGGGVSAQVPVWDAAGHTGSALRFDGVNDLVDCGNSPVLDIVGPLTIEAWIKPELTPDYLARLVSKSIYPYYPYELLFKTTSGLGGPGWWFRTEPPFNRTGYTNDSVTLDGKWNQVVLVYDGASARAYINGVYEPAPQYFTDPIRSTPTAHLFIGARYNGTYPFKGLVDDVKIYNRALSKDEVGSSFAQGMGGTCVRNCPTKHCGDDPADGCGDTCTGYCPPGGEDCHSNAECSGGATCVTSPTRTKCVLPHCVNQVRDEGETGIDCGGSDCLACDDLCVPQCQGKQCGDDPADGCGGACTGFCDPGQAGCTTATDCPALQTCGIGMGPRFGLAAGVNVCWPQACEVQDSSLPNGGVDPTVCGTSPSCTGSCEGSSDSGPNGCGPELYCGLCPGGQTRGASGMCSEPVAAYNPNGSGFPRDVPSLPFSTVLAGAIPGAFSVTDQGKANYRMPIEVPPGRLGMQPSLAFVYNGSKANGYLGIGWNLSGLSTITRCPQTIAREGQARGIAYDGSDTFCLDGEALVWNGVDSFRTEIDKFSRIYPLGPQGNALGRGVDPAYFEVLTRDGRKLRYGFTSGSSLSTTSAVKRLWALDRVLDLVGNRMDIRYVSNVTQVAYRSAEQINAEIRRAAGEEPSTLPPSTDWFVEAEILPLVIAYGGVENLVAQNHTRFVSFQYERRPDPQYLYSGGYGKDLINRLKSVTTYVGEREARRYVPTYSVSIPGGPPPAGRVVFDAADEMISRIQVQSTDWTSHGDDPDTSQVHELGPGTVFRTTPVRYEWNEEAWTQTVPQFLGITLDVNGDGLADIVYSDVAHDQTRIRLATPSTSGAYTYVDLLAVSGPDAPLPAWSSGTDINSQTPKNRLTGIDVDRNGNDELLFGTHIYSFQGHDETTAYFAQQPAFGPVLPETIDVLYADEPTPVWQQTGLRGDWNGDGLPDLAVCSDTEVDPRGTLKGRFTAFLSEITDGAVHLGSGTLVEMHSGIPCSALEVLDSDNDGKDEIVRPAMLGDPTGSIAISTYQVQPTNGGISHLWSHGAWTIKPTNGFPRMLGREGPPSLMNPNSVGGRTVVPRVSGDFNGDGLRDLVSVEAPLLDPPDPSDYNHDLNDRMHELVLWEATGAGSYQPVVLDFGVDSNDSNLELDTAHADITNAVAMDWNGDGRDELIIGNNAKKLRLNIDGTPLPGQIPWLDNGPWPGRSNGIWIGVVSGPEPNARLVDGSGPPRKVIKFTKVTSEYHGRLRVIPDVNGDQVPELVDTERGLMMSPPMNLDAGRLHEVLDGLGRRTSIRYASASNYSRSTCVWNLAAGYDCMNRPGGLVAGYEDQQVWNGQGPPVGPGPSYGFRYYDARRGFNGRGSYGFAKREIETFGGKGQRITTIKYNNTDFVLAGRVSERKTQVIGANTPDDFQNSNNGYEILETQTWVPRNPSTGSSFAVLTLVDHSESNVGVVNTLLTRQTTTFTRNDFGEETNHIANFWVGGSIRATQVVATERVDLPPVYGLPETVTATDTRGTGLGSSATRVTKYGYKPNGLLWTVERDPDQVEDASVYHKLTIETDLIFGTPVSSCSTEGIGAGERCTYFDEYSDGHVFPTVLRVTGPGVDYDLQRAYSPVDGQLLLSWDAAGRVSEFAYDPFGRPSGIDTATERGRITRSQRISQTSTPYSDVTVNGALVVSSEFAGQGVTDEVFDAFGRNVQTIVPAAFGTKVYQEFVYNSFGQPEKATMPHGQGEATRGVISYFYDGQDRLTSTVVYDGTVSGQETQYSYPTRANNKKNWFSEFETAASARVVTDPRGISRAQVFGARGVVLKSIETTPTSTTDTTTTYTYGPFDTLKTILAPHSGPAADTTTIVSDAYGRVQSTSSATTGVQSRTYNGFDEVVTTTDALMRSKYSKYDGLGRVIEVHEGLVETAHPIAKWTYDGDDAATKGLLVHAYRRYEQDSQDPEPEEQGSWMNFTYGSTGLPRLVEYSLGGSPDDSATGEPFVFGYAYDSAVPGRLTHVTYPSQAGAFTVQNGYDEVGFFGSVGTGPTLTKVGPVYVPDPEDPEATPPTPYWELTQAENGLWPKREVFKNGVATDRTYFLPDNCLTGEAGDSCVSGMPKSIKTSFGSSVRLDEAYKYDKGSNLTSIVPSNVPTARTVFDYDNHDQLAGVTTYPAATRIDVGADASGDFFPNGPYVYDPARPHIIQSIQRVTGTLTYHFDANGSLQDRSGVGIPGGSQTFTYNDFGMPWKIESGGTATYLQYDAAQHRISKTKSPSTPASEHIYAGELFERVTENGTTTYVYNIFAGDQQVARFTRTATNGPITERYLHSDRLGSTRLTSDATGNTQARAFSAFGSSTSSFTDVQASGQSGFTGHEHDEDLGLVNMQGRLYDPLSQRFIQPDPLVTDPTTPIGLNPYPYARNNPLKYVDPSGFDSQTVTCTKEPNEPGVCDVLVITNKDEPEETKSGSGAGPARPPDPKPSGTKSPGPKPPGPKPPNALRNKGYGWSDDLYPDDDQAWREASTAPTAFAPPVSNRVMAEPEFRGDPDAAGFWQTAGEVQFAIISTILTGPLGIGRAAATTEGAVISRGACAGGVCMCFVAGTRVDDESGGKAIEETQLGSRVGPELPECSAPQLAGWREIQLLMTSNDWDEPHDLDVRLLRPEEWIQQVGAVEGRAIQLKLDEIGLSGSALITKIGSAGHIAPGTRCPVTGWIRHTSRDVMRLGLDQDEHLLVSRQHRLFSATRGDWVPAGKLWVGEALQTKEGLVQVTSVGSETLPPVEVFNLEVFGANQYFVGEHATLAHNNCGAAAAARAITHGHHPWPKYLGGPTKQALEQLSQKLHTAYHAGLDKILPRWRGTEYYNAMSATEKIRNFEKLAEYTRQFDAAHGTQLWEALMATAQSLK